MNRESIRKPHTRPQIATLANEIRDLLADPDASLTATSRARWEGALAALETVLGQRSSLVAEDPELL